MKLNVEVEVAQYSVLGYFHDDPLNFTRIAGPQEVVYIVRADNNYLLSESFQYEPTGRACVVTHARVKFTSCDEPFVIKTRITSNDGRQPIRISDSTIQNNGY